MHQATFKTFARKGLTLLSLALASATALAGPAEVTTPAAKEKSLCDRLWDLPVLYKNDRNPFLEEFALTGRFQLDYFNVDSNRGDNDFLEIRRFRLGIDSWWADRHIQVKATVDTALRNYNADSVFYNRMTDLFVNFHFNDAVNLRIGKFEPHFGYDREFSDNQHKFFERSFFDEQIFNNTGNDYASGVSLSGKVQKWGYQVAAFSNNVDKEYGQFNGGQSYLAEVSYDFSKDLGADKALWALDYMHMENHGNSNVFNTMENAAATYFDYQKDRFGFVAQLGYGNGLAAKGDLYEIMVMPSFLITKNLEAVFRYQYGTAENDNGIAILNRQEKTVGKFTGDTYQAAYLGLNYYVYGQKMKFMVGEQYTDLTGGTGISDGYQAWTTLVGFRIYW